MKTLFYLGDALLFLSLIVVIGAGILLSIKTQFVQFRKLPQMLKLFFTLIFKRHTQEEGSATVRAHRALFTAMSTTIGISTIVSPFIAIRLGGPGAIIGFLIATLLGAAVNYSEVTFAIAYRKHHHGTGISGGPMQYLRDEIHPFIAKWYAFFGFLLLMTWSAAQANQLSEILNSPLLGRFRVPNWATALFLAVSITLILIGGIKRIASFSAKLVPMMFVIYVGGALWIVFLNLNRFGEIFQLVFNSWFSPQALGTGFAIGAILTSLRWGVFKSLQSNEAGVGTQTIPHSMAETETAVDQGILSMIATYSAGFICILSCLVALFTETWMDDSLSLGINMVAASFQVYFSFIGIVIVLVSAILFAVGTILGNSYNGSQCFLYITKNRYLKIYYLATAMLIFFGCLMDVKAVWSAVDYFLVPVVLPHILSLVYLSYKRKEILIGEAFTESIPPA